MALLTNEFIEKWSTALLRKLRRPKSETMTEAERLEKVRKVMDKKPEPLHFKGDLLNGWEHDGEPKHWHSNYFDRRKK